MSELTAPNEGDADTPSEIADELCDALLAFEHVDYNALTVDELNAVLEARESIEEICLRYRRQQHSQDRRSGNGGDAGD
jgi:hypothetical protein